MGCRGNAAGRQAAIYVLCERLHLGYVLGAGGIPRTKCSPSQNPR
ncbi:MAG: hypothetical protein QOG83_2549 [Alphaproteobacteria bacterium]|nr:hypothetical protein [Alphaproteobacteria bacterium]